MNILYVNMRRLHADVVMPEYASAGAACLDIMAYMPGKSAFIQNINQRYIFDTGLCFEVPKDHVLMVYSRSGHGFNHGMRLSNCVGVIDSDYRGELKVSITRDAEDFTTASAGFSINHGDRIAQIMLVPIPKVIVCFVDQLSDTARGVGGFGSTGA